MTMGIYCIQIEKDNYWCSYVGTSINIEKRWREHKNSLRRNCHHNKYLQNSWNKYKESNFEFHILEEVDYYGKLYKLEKEYAYTFGYGDPAICFNIGSPGESTPFVGRKLSEEHKRKISESRQGEKNPMFGKKCSEEHKQKIRESNQGEKGNNAKLTELQARFILTVKTTRKNHMNSDFKQQELANYFEVGVRCIKHVMEQSSWKHIEPLPIEEYEKMKQELLSKKEV